MAHRLLLVLVALLLTLFTWLGGGIVASWLSPWALWMALLTAEVLLLLPEQRRSESLFDARKRVWRGLLRDPLMWFAVLLMLFLSVQWLNGGTFLEWQPKTQTWQTVSPAFEALRAPEAARHLASRPATPETAAYLPIGKAPWPWLPSCLRSDEAFGVLNWFIPVLTALLAVKHGLGKRSKRWLGLYICAMSAVLAIAGFIQYAVGGEFLYWGRKSNAFFFATFGYPNHAACFFPAVMAWAMGMLLWSVEHREHTRVKPWCYAATVVLCGAAAILSGSRAGMLFTLAMVAFTALYVPVRYLGSWPTRWRVLVPLLLFLGAGVVLGTAGFRVYAMNANREAKAALAAAKTPEARAAASNLRTYGTIPALDNVLMEIADTPWAEFFEHPMLMRSGYQGILALRQAEDHPWYGTGAWSFRWLNVRYIRADVPEEQAWLKARLGVGQANVHNDTLQFLAEHGAIGFGLMLGCVAALCLPFLWQLLRSPAYTVSDELTDRIWLNRINAFYLYAFVGTSLIAVHSFIDLVFRSPACMMLYGLFFVCAPGFLLGTPKPARPAAPASPASPPSPPSPPATQGTPAHA